MRGWPAWVGPPRGVPLPTDGARRLQRELKKGSRFSGALYADRFVKLVLRRNNDEGYDFLVVVSSSQFDGTQLR